MQHGVLAWAWRNNAGVHSSLSATRAQVLTTPQFNALHLHSTADTSQLTKMSHGLPVF